MVRKITPISLLLSVVLLAIGCGLKSPFIEHKEFTRPNYETIRIGETKPEVLEMLGQPATELTDGTGGMAEHETWIYANEKPYYRAAIEFEGGHVTHKRFTIDKSQDLMPTTATAPATKPAKHHSRSVL